MAKDLPYFKFYISEWADGDITLETYKVQGLFINICAYYWSKECQLSYETLQKKFKTSKKLIETLVEKNIIKIIDNHVTISFLNEQFEEREKESLQKAKNGSLGGRGKKRIKSYEKPTALIQLSETESKTKLIREEEKRREYIQLCNCVCEIFGRAYEPDPEARMPGLVNWYKTIEYQCDLILQTWSIDVAIKQVKAYTKHCKETNRIKISTDYKVAETILQVDWCQMTKVEMTTKDPYEEARHNKTLWTHEAWESYYRGKITFDKGFRKAFGYEELPTSSPMGNDPKRRQSA